MAPNSPSRPLTELMRRVPHLLPDDGLTRAAALLRNDGGPLPVVDHRGRLIGTLSAEDLRGALQLPPEAREAATVRAYMRPPADVVLNSVAPDELAEAVRRSESAALMVTDECGHLLGRVHLTDLFRPAEDVPWLGPINGMATPWGVYLSANGLQAGSSNLMLVGGGMALGAILAVAHVLTGLVLHSLSRAGMPELLVLYLSQVPPQDKALAAVWSLLQLSPMLLFLLMMRTLAVAGYHAAEHQVVHAIERGEPLLPEVVRRMPRVHPRCGTNAIAALAVFVGVSQLFVWMAGSAAAGADAALVGAAAAVFGWRRLGAFVQQHFVTRPPSDDQLRCGIAAANELIEKSRRTVPSRVRSVRRLWCLALPQTAAGVAVTATLGFYLSNTLLRSLGP